MANEVKRMLILSLAVAIGSCEGAKNPPPAPVAPPEVAVAPFEDLDIDQGVDNYIYTPVGKRDPFRSAYKDLLQESKQTEPKTPLQGFEIDQLKLIAVISGIAQPMAMILAPDGKGYSVQLGTYVGKNNGRVVRIRTAEVIIAEDFKDWNQKKVTNFITIKLKKEAEK